MTSYIFPGQGSQYFGMAKDFYDNFSIAKITFEEIEEYVGINLKKIIFEDDTGLLNQTNFTQISIFAASVAIFKTLETEKGLGSSVFSMFGHSLGEYTALACSNKISLSQISLILKKRGQLMNQAVEQNKTGMVALIGKDSQNVSEIIKNNNIDLEIANDNSPIQVVLSGKISSIEESKKIFLENGIKKYIKLNVSSAFHSKYMLNAESSLANEIEKLEFKSNNINIISNFNAEISNNSNIIKENLKNQMSNRVRWTESIKKIEVLDKKNIIEIGPGNVLSGLIKRISNKFDIKSVNKISDLQNL